MPAPSPFPLGLIDRLRQGGDEDPAPARDEDEDFLRFRDQVMRDVETLLNSRTCCRSLPAGLVEAEDSVLTYGLPDFSAMTFSTEKQRKQFTRLIEETIRRHEPRIHAVSVTLVDGRDRLDRHLRFRIEAVIRARGVADPELSFDSVMEPVAFGITLKPGASHG